jgi:hypothetical protein
LASISTAQKLGGLVGEIAEMMLDGTLCQNCGTFLGVRVIRENGGKVEGSEIIEPPGFPISCENCEE